MPQQHSIAAQAAVVAREISALIELLDEMGAAPVADAIEVVESAGRLMDCARVRVLAPLVGNAALVERLGAASAADAVASIARISQRSARARLKVTAAVSANRAITGAPVPAPRQVVSEALDAGTLGLDAATLIATELDSIDGRVRADVLEVAESVMVGLATGVTPDGQPMASAVSVEYLAGEIRRVTATADPDGARPREERARRRRDFRLGAPDEDGLVAPHGKLMPEVGSLLELLMESYRRSPYFVDAGAGLLSTDDPAFSVDPRTPGQRRHDALAEILMAAAAAEGAPRLDGQPVAVLITASAAELAREDGLDGDPIGTMAGSPVPVSRGRLERFMDAGGFRLVTLDDNGAVVGISSPQRCFTPLQRLGMAARDGLGCITPGCTSPHFALQAHHVIPDRDGGPTAIDNGILLCYWHHLIVDTGPWQYRMIVGVPHVRGPGIPEWTPARKHLARAA